MEETTIYLGDGAYATLTGYSYIVFTSNGVTTANEIELEFGAIEKLYQAMKDAREKRRKELGL